MTLTKRLQWLKLLPGRENRSAKIYERFDNASRYEIDFSLTPGWLQYDTDQDADYFGAWVNPSDLLILTYCEGDWELVVYQSPILYDDQLTHMGEFYGVGHIAKVLDESGITTYRQDRAEFFARGA